MNFRNQYFVSFVVLIVFLVGFCTCSQQKPTGASSGKKYIVRGNVIICQAWQIGGSNYDRFFKLMINDLNQAFCCSSLALLNITN